MIPKEENSRKILVAAIILGIILVSVFALRLSDISRLTLSGEDIKERVIAIIPNVSDEEISGEYFYQATINSSYIEKSEISRSQVNHSTIRDSIIKFSNSTGSYFIDCIILFSSITKAYLRNSIVIKSTVSNSIYRNTTFQETETNNVIELTKAEENLIVYQFAKGKVCYTIWEKKVTNIDLNLPYDGYGLIAHSLLENSTIRISNAKAVAIIASNLRNVSLMIENVRQVLIYETCFMNSTVETLNCSEIKLHNVYVPAIDKYRAITIDFKDTNLILSDKGIKTIEIKRGGGE